MNQPALALDAEEVEAPRPTATKKRRSRSTEVAEPVTHQPPAVAEPVDPQTAMIQMIERVALDPNASIEKLEKMLDLRERIEDRAKEDRREEQRAAYHRAMAACQAELKVVKKNKRNSQTNSNYADLAALAKAADPVIHRHGFTFSTQPAGRAENGDEKIRWTIAHAEGHVETDVAQLALDDKGPNGSKNKTGLHGFGSTMSYGRRYLKLMLFDIATSDDDDGNAGGGGADTITDDQFNALFNLMDECGADERAFVGVYGVDHLRDLPAKMFGPAHQLLSQRVAKRRAEAKGNA